MSERVDTEGLKRRVPMSVVAQAFPALGHVRQVSADRWEGDERGGPHTGHSSLVITDSRHLAMWYQANRSYDQFSWLMKLCGLTWWEAVEEMERLAGGGAPARAPAHLPAPTNDAPGDSLPPEPRDHPRGPWWTRCMPR